MCIFQLSTLYLLFLQILKYERQATSGTVSFGNSDDGPKLFTIPITTDTVVEGNETFRVILKTMDGRTLGSTLVTIADGVKAAGPGNLEFLQDSYSIREDKGSIDVTMVRNGGVIGTVGVSYSTNNGSALAGSDYTSTSGTVTFAEGETSKVVTIPIVDNTVYEDDETFTITLSSPTGGASLGIPSYTVVQINDDDLPPPVISSIDESIGYQGTSIEVVITGTNLGVLPTVQVSGSDVNASITSITATQINAVISVLSTAAIGSRDLTVTANGIVSNKISFEIKDLSVLEAIQLLELSSPTCSTEPVKIIEKGEEVCWPFYITRTPVPPGGCDDNKISSYVFNMTPKITYRDKPLKPFDGTYVLHPSAKIKACQQAAITIKTNSSIEAGIYDVVIVRTIDKIKLLSTGENYSINDDLKWTLKVNAEPELSGPDTITRGDAATFTIENGKGATISDWRFKGTVTKDSTGATEDVIINRTTSTGSTTWSGMMVTSGKVKVRVKRGGKTYDLEKAITVTPRTNFAWLPVPPTEKDNNFMTEGGKLMSVPSPPIPDKELGVFHTQLGFSYVTQDIADNGPNHRVKYVKSITDSDTTTGKVIPTRFYYVISPDLKNTSSEFYKKQCGDYDKVKNPSGFISGAQLLANTIHHESGPLKNSHYSNYVAAQNNTDNNIGIVGEKITGLPAKTFDEFSTQVSRALNQAVDRINRAAEVESCGKSDARLDANCVMQGNINFTPYTTCR